jgi:hypothetical protein
MLLDWLNFYKKYAFWTITIAIALSVMYDITHSEPIAIYSNFIVLLMNPYILNKFSLNNQIKIFGTGIIIVSIVNIINTILYYFNSPLVSTLFDINVHWIVYTTFAILDLFIITIVVKELNHVNT